MLLIFKALFQRTLWGIIKQLNCREIGVMDMLKSMPSPSWILYVSRGPYFSDFLVIHSAILLYSVITVITVITLQLYRSSRRVQHWLLSYLVKASCICRSACVCQAELMAYRWPLPLLKTIALMDNKFYRTPYPSYIQIFQIFFNL